MRIPLILMKERKKGKSPNEQLSFVCAFRDSKGGEKETCPFYFIPSDRSSTITFEWHFESYQTLSEKSLLMKKITDRSNISSNYR